MSATLKTYLKSALKQFLISLIFPLAVFFIIDDKEWIYASVFFDLLGLIPGYYRYSDSLKYEEKLKAKGLTIADLKNIEFAKKWFAIRKSGIVKYSIVDGGVFFGFFLSLFISIGVFCTYKSALPYVKTDLTHMFNFIGLTYLAGAMSGVIIYRVLWVRNERKFIRLTDPLH